MGERIVITGLGSVSALGVGVEPFRSALLAGTAGIRNLEKIDCSGLRVVIGAQVPHFNAADYLDEALLPYLDRFSQFALIATKEALNDSGLTAGQYENAAAIIGTGCGGKETDEATYSQLYRDGRSRVHPLTIPRGMPSAAASQVSLQMKIKGPVFSVTSACSSSGHAIAQAALMIRHGLVDVAIAGGTDAPFTCGLLKSWDMLRVMSKDTCRPFSKDRSGMVLGEGAGILVLESERHAKARDADIYAELAGFGMSSDAGHITDPSVDGAARTIGLCLQDAQLSPADVQYINAHGTATQANDVTETAAISKVFKENAASLAVSSTKSMHGHALGAAGGIELVATVLSVKEGFIPPTVNFTEAGDGCDLDYVPNEVRFGSIDAALSNSFAFGGLNAVLAVRVFQ
ncbi:MAG: beta-ACP synthase [Gammaproteobacteria bacterium (ex Lamellibrachia satsuma)]|nr:MAG: beta-ketoacyl-[acyl-carrier-protein] synthase family protein [Gammaproteobacteria bacterium (ex Lamellibrachia satsuma)]RRS34898.1 MAG: beta-ACP synthase [Gammaproteobacteria bacterium (ex Lamellibrachia satsuma)]RRS37138.1 MAG: beta-ACP synthase [Gammaproteobacteria bacterium (ex Lamellibrachia satsuma)]